MARRKSADRKSSSEFDRHHRDASAEANALGTSAAAMVLGIIAGEAIGHHPAAATQSDAPSGDGVSTAPPPNVLASDADPSHAVAALAVADPMSRAAAGTPADHGALAPADRHEHTAADHLLTGQAHAPPVDASHEPAHTPLHPGSVTDPGIDSGNVAEHAGSLPSGGAVVESGAMLHDIGANMTGTLDHSIDALAADVNGVLQHTLSPEPLALGSLADQISATAATVTHTVLAAPAALAGSMVTGIFDSGSHHPEAAATAPTLDSAPAIPAPPPLMPLHIGFAGQPHIDGTDAHDGAFSALGMHHL